MYRRVIWFSALVALVVAVSCSVAAATPTTVQLRVEGATSTIFEGRVTTDGHDVDGGDRTGLHPCDGTNAGAHPSPGPTVTATLADAGVPGGWHGTWNSGFSDFLIDAVAGENGSATSYWGTVRNFKPTDLGGCQEQVSAGDEVLFALGDIYAQRLLRLTGAMSAAPGETIKLMVTDGKTGDPVERATITGAPTPAITGADGSATIELTSLGVTRLKAAAPDSIRSNSLYVSVSPTGSSGVAQLPGASVRDSRAPLARITSPRHGATYRRGPRLLRGTARDDESGLTAVKLSLRRHVHGQQCRTWNAIRERFVGGGCGKKFFGIGSDSHWSYLLPSRLRPGRYILDVTASDRAANSETTFRQGQNRAIFYVRHSPRRSRTRASAARSGKVRVMVVGRTRTLAEARAVRAGTTVIRASGHRCKVGSSTPLAALIRTLRLSRTGYHVRDFGRCSSRSPSSSAQLFVDRVGSDRNARRDGWYYKVNDLAGSAGAADPAGIPGGRLRAGDRVLWLYCRFDVAAHSCQRSLRLTVSSTSLSLPASLGVTVRSFDDGGRARPVVGASVALGPVSSSTNRLGRAELRPPAAGRYLVEASSAGTIPAFPVSVEVVAPGA